MSLRPDLFQSLLEAFLDTFRSEADLAIRLQLTLGIRLAEITGAGNLREQVFDLINYMDARERIKDLGTVALQEAPDKTELKEAIETALDPGRRFGLAIHNWTRSSTPIRIDRELDWTAYFDRPSSRVPTVEQWERDLLPALMDVRAEFRATAAGAQSLHTIRFRGRCCLSTAVAVGNTFPYTDGWRIEVEQQNGRWWSDAAADGPETVIREEVWDETARDLALVVSVTGDAWPQVQNFLSEGGPAIRAVVTAQSAAGMGQTAMAAGGHASQFAQAVKGYLGTAVARHRAEVTHLFVYGPMGLAAFLGHYLSRVGTLQCYEPQNHGYAPSCVLHT